MIAAIILAAGSSRRMGRDKARLTIGTRALTFVDAILETLAAAKVEVVRVVVPKGPGRWPPDSVVNPDPSRGMLSSVQCGLRALPPGIEAVLLWPVDHPLVRRDTLIAMIAAYRAATPPVVVPIFEGARGHPVLFAARVIPELLSADLAGGARTVVHAHDDRREIVVDDRGVIEDIDTPEDYARICRDAVRPPSEPR